MSLRRRLLIILLVTLSGVWLFSASANYFDSRHEIEELLDAELTQTAGVLLALSKNELMQERLATGPTTIAIEEHMIAGKADPAHKYGKRLAFQVWLGDSTLALRSSSAPSIPLSTVREGFSDEIVGNEPWRIFSILHPKLPIMIQVGERYEVRGDLPGQIALRMLTPVLITPPLLALIIWYAVGFAMRPLNRIASEVAVREANHLDPVNHQFVPIEAKPLVQSLNALLIRLQKAFDSERRFTADAAHELRTPLAAIRAQAQVAQKAIDAQDQQRALQKVINAVDNATRVAHQLLTLARIDPATSLVGFKKVDLCYCATDVMSELVPLALKKNIDISLSESCQGTINGNADALVILITNLIHNAINYTPESGVIVVDIVAENDTVTLSVSDSGPGIPTAEREKVLQRFYRGRDVTQAGSGLGLSIVKRIAELHTARIVLTESTMGGLRVEVIFPALS
jgi:two-component system sensor histidine kinase QseC